MAKEIYRRGNREGKNEVIKNKNQSWEKKCKIEGSRDSEAWNIVKLVRIPKTKDTTLEA